MARIRAAAAAPDGLAPSGPYAPFPLERAGLVWTPPPGTAAALDELLRLRRAGVRAVRLPMVEDTFLLAAADLLGIALWQDMPMANLAAEHLIRALPEAEQLLGRSLALAHRYGSARHFGLASYSDTSDPRARPYFERLTALARAQGPEGTRTYYLTRFPRADRCAHTVDLVLLDARDASPSAVLASWAARHEQAAGIGAFGASVRPGVEGGWRTPGTYQSQARALERGLEELLSLDVPAVFVYRYRDDTPAGPSPLLGADVRGTAHGLVSVDGTPRPAFRVLQGFFTGSQRVFAFDAGPPAAGQYAASPLVLAGWGLVLLLGLLYAGTSRFPTLAGRYFGRHDLYREAVQRGFDLEAGLNGLLGAGVALSAGVVGTSALRGLARTDALTAATVGLGAEAQAVLATLLGRPALLTLTIAVAYVAWLMIHMVWLHVLAGRRSRLRPAQALTLAVWSRWGVVALLGAAMLLAAAPASSATAGVPLLLGGWAVVEFVALGRETADLAAVARVSPARAQGIGFGVPALLMAVVLLAAGLAMRPELAFLWHLATRG
jgi:hypothetical protein